MHFSGAVYPASANLASCADKADNQAGYWKISIPLSKNFMTGVFLKKTILFCRADAYPWIHNPPDEKKLIAAKRRLKYDEFFLMQLGLALRRFRNRHFCNSVKIGIRRANRPANQKTFSIFAHRRPGLL